LAYSINDKTTINYQVEAKDQGSLAVLMAIMFAVIVWLVILF